MPDSAHRHVREATYLGIDVGSTTTKAIVFDPAGTPLASGGQGYQTVRPTHDGAEQHAELWLAAVDASVAQLATQVELSTVTAVGVTSQVDTHVLVDDNCTPLHPALFWQDVRSAGEALDLNARLGEAGRNDGWGAAEPLDASNPVPRALWLARHRPDEWARSRWMLQPKDLVNAWLTGQVASDPLSWFKIVGTDAQYVGGIRHAPGLGGRLPRLCSPDDELGRLNRVWHGIPAGAVVATGTMDAFGNVLGSGLHQPGDTMMITGTSVIVGAIGIGGTTGPGVVDFVPFRGRQVHAGPTQSGGDSLRWWARVTGHTIDDVLAAAAGAPPGSDGVVFAPHLLGERAPLWDARVRGWFTGLESGAGFAELSRAVLEGVAYSARELLAAVQVAAAVPCERIMLSGGGSRSDLWCQILADVIGHPIRRSREADSAVVGAATLAAAARTGSDPWSQGALLAQHDRVFTPDPGLRRRYDDLFSLYTETYHALRPVHERLSAITGPTTKGRP